MSVAGMSQRLEENHAKENEADALGRQMQKSGRGRGKAQKIGCCYGESTARNQRLHVRIALSSASMFLGTSNDCLDLLFQAERGVRC